MKKIKITGADVLVGIDFQRDLIDGVLGSNRAMEAANLAANVLSKFADADAGVYLTQDLHDRKSYRDTIEGKAVDPHCIKNSEGSGINSRIGDILGYDGVRVLPKNTFLYHGWGNELSVYKDTRIFICGLVTDVCVVSNALALRSVFPTIPMYCIRDCCAGSTPEKHLSALDVMTSCLVSIIDSTDLE